MEEVTERGLVGHEGVAAAALQTGTRGPGVAAGCPAKNKQTDRHIRQSRWVSQEGSSWRCPNPLPGSSYQLGGETPEVLEQFKQLESRKT